MKKKRLFSAVLSLVTTVSLSLGSFAGAGVVSAQSDSSAYGEVLVSDTSNSDWTIAPGNTSRNLAVSPDGSIYAVYNGGDEIRVAKSTDNGKTFQPSVLAATGSFEPEIAVSSSGTVYVVGINESAGVLVKSTDGGKTFSDPIAVGAFLGTSAHMAVDGSYIYVTSPSGSTLYYSSNEGTTFNNYDFNESYVFTDLHVDPQTGNLIVQKDNPSLKYYVSKDHGQSFGTPVIPEKNVFFSVGALSAGSKGQYLFVAGSDSNMVRMNIGDGTVTDLMGGNNMSSQGRSLSADSYGNVVTGFSNGSSVFFSVSQDLGANLSSPVEVAATSIANAAINTTNGDIMYLYEKSGKIYLKVYQGLLSGYKLYLSNTNLYFNYPTQKKVSVTVTNTSDAPLKIGEVLINGDFKITDNTVPPELAPGESGIIEVQYSPQGAGSSNGALTLKVDGEPDRVVLLSGISEAAAGSSAPQVEDVTANSTTDIVTVKKVPAGTKVTVYAADGVTVLGTATNEAGTAGEVAIAIPAGLTAGDTVKVSLIEPDLTESTLTDITAHNEVTSAPAAADVTANATTDTVTVKKVPAGAEVTVYAADGVTVLGTAKNEAGTSGEVTVSVPAGLQSGDVIKVSLTEPEKTESPLTDITAHSEVTSAPAAADVTANATKDTVTVTKVPAGAEVTVYATDGVTVLGTAKNEAETSGEVTVPVSAGLQSGDVIKVSLTEPEKSGSPLTDITAHSEVTSVPAAADMTANATKDTVTVTKVPAGAKVTVYAADGVTVLGTAKNEAETSGEVTVPVPAGLKSGDVIKISLTEREMSESPLTDITAHNEVTSAPAAVGITANATKDAVTVTKVPAGAEVTVYAADGVTVLGTAKNEAETSGEVTVPVQAGLQSGDVVKVSLTEREMSESPLTDITAHSEVTSAPATADVTANATTDTVTVKKVPAGAEITVYAADGVTVLGTAKNETETSGEVTVSVPAGLQSGDVIKVSLTEPEKTESPLTDITAHSEVTSAPAAADMTANATTDTVTVKKVPAGTKVTVYAADGVTMLGTTTNEAGTAGEVAIAIPAGLTAGDVIKVSLTEPELTESTLTDITAHSEVTSTPAAADITANATSSTVTVKNVPVGATVTVYGEDGLNVLGTAVNESGSPAELIITIASGLADGQILKVGTWELGKDPSPLTEIPAAYEPTQAPAAGNLIANATTGVVTVNNVPANVTASVYAEDGTTLLGTSFNDTGALAEFHFAVKGLEPGQIVKISFTETNKAQSAKVEVAAVYEQSAQPLAGNIVISAAQGKFTVNQVPAGAVVSIYSKEGKLLASATNTGAVAGPLTFTEIALTEGDTLTVTLTEKLKTESAPLSVTVAIKSADVVNEASKTLQIGYAAGETWENVLTSLSLPSTGGFGTQVSWTSSKPQVIEIPAATDSSINAVVYRSAQDEAVVLSATVSRDGEAKTRTFLVVVTASGAIKVEDTSNIRNVKVKDQSDNTALVPVKRINVTSADGTSSKMDKVVFDSAKAQEIVTASVPGHNNSSTIYIDELPGDTADEIAVEIPATTLALLGANSFNLNIQSDYSTISLDAATLQSMMADNLDLYFRIVPARNAEDSKNQVPSSYNNQNLKALSPPLDIETNYTGYNTQLMLPFAKNGVDVSTMNASSLAVYIVHSDGTIELSKGTVVNNDKNEPYGISFDISKFSSFSIVETSSSLPGSIVTGPATPATPAAPVVVPNGAGTATATDAVYSHAAYIKGYEDGTFKPSRALTRAELAALLARNIEIDAAASGVNFTDVSAKHWAAADIAKVAAAGLMKGDPDGSFNPERAVTRAEMAILSARLKQLSFDESSTAVSAISDVNKHWAAGAIDAVKAAGLMTGFADGSFAPAKMLSRAEAVTVINRLFGRGPLSGVTRSSFSDVPVTHWAFADIEEASLNHKYTVKNGKEVIAD
ncbi:S-layer homology domain-containing protein [Paenibacillus pedocola]|uniref:S-layer homology domain-containing protein n=1 Tax=Paenibacillus pedocola TaxID=3242193 RepID=UPI0028778022|nr:S-layer homology domain-containing protein [Paenibacillus typhae]